MSIQQFFQSLAERLSSTSVKTVYGEPIEASGKTIIPVAKIAYGFGGGSGTSEEEQEKAEGGGGGGGVAAKPVGVVEITQEKTRFISFGEKKKLVGALIIGVFLGILLGRRCFKCLRE